MADTITDVLIKIMAQVDPSVQAAVNSTKQQMGQLDGGGQSTAEASKKAAQEKAAAEEQAGARTREAVQRTSQAQQDAMERMRAGAQETAMAWGAVAATLGILAQQIVQRTTEFDVYRTKLQTLMKDSSAAENELQRAVQMAAATPFSVGSVVDASVKLRTYKQDVEALLPLAGDLAAAMGRDINEAAAALGKAFSGSADGVQVLADSFGISKMRLRELGAEMSTDGGIVLHSAEQIDKFKAAVTSIITADYLGGMARQAATLKGSLSNLGDAFEGAFRGVGQSVAPVLITLTQGLTGLVNAVASLPAPLQAMVFGMGGAVGTFAAFAATAGGIATFLPMLTSAISGLRTTLVSAGVAMRAFLLAAAPFAPMLLAIGAAVAVLASVNSYYARLKEQAADQERATLATEHQRRALVDLRAATDDLRNIDSSRMKELGVTAEEVGASINELRRQVGDYMQALEYARERGDKAAADEMRSRIEEIKAQVAQLQRAREDLLRTAAGFRSDVAEASQDYREVKSKFGADLPVSVRQDKTEFDAAGNIKSQEKGGIEVSEQTLKAIETRLSSINDLKAAGVITASQEAELYQQIADAIERVKASGLAVSPQVAEQLGNAAVELQAKIRTATAGSVREGVDAGTKLREAADKDAQDRIAKDDAWLAHRRALNQVSATEEVSIATRRIQAIDFMEFGSSEAKKKARLNAEQQLDVALRNLDQERTGKYVENADRAAQARINAAGRNKAEQQKALEDELQTLTTGELSKKPDVMRRAEAIRQELIRRRVTEEEQAEDRIVDNFIRAQNRMLAELKKRPQVATGAVIDYVQAQANEADARARELVRRGVSEDDSRVQSYRRQAEARQSEADQLREQALQKALDIEKHILEVRKQAASLDLERLTQRAAKGEAVEDQIIAKVKERLQLEMDQIAQKREEELRTLDLTTEQGKKAAEMVNEEAQQAARQAADDTAKTVDGIIDKLKGTAEDVAKRLQAVVDQFQDSRLGGRRSPLRSMEEINAAADAQYGEEQGMFGQGPSFDFSLRLGKSSGATTATSKLEQFRDQLLKTGDSLVATLQDVKKALVDALAASKKTGGGGSTTEQTDQPKKEKIPAPSAYNPNLPTMTEYGGTKALPPGYQGGGVTSSPGVDNPGSSGPVSQTIINVPGLSVGMDAEKALKSFADAVQRRANTQVGVA